MALKRWMFAKLRNGMIATVALPLAVLSVLSIAIMTERLKDLSGYARLTANMSLIYDMGALIHEQQKERGATSVFLNSGGQTYGRELTAQRLLTDAAMANIRKTLETIAEPAETRLGSTLRRIEAGLNDRMSLREAVDGLNIAIGDALGAYTAHNALLLQATSEIGKASNNRDIGILVLALESFLKGKEFSGIERAVGSGGFASGGFSITSATRVNGLIIRQQSAFDTFKRLASERDLAAYREIEDLPATAELARMRAVAFRSVETGDIEGVTAANFFEAATVRIDAQKVLEDSMIAALADLTKKKSREETAIVAVVASSLLLGAGLSIWLTMFCIRNMLLSVRKISNAGDRLAKGDETAQLPDDSPAELGRIVWSINAFRKSVVEGREREAEIVEQRNAAEAEARTENEKRQKAEAERAKKEADEAREEQARMQLYAKEISAVVSACANGDFTQRISLEGKEGVLAELSDGLNRISDGVAASLDDIRKALDHIAHGDMTYRMDTTAKGVFAEIATAMTDATNNMQGVLARVTQSTGSVSEATNGISAQIDDLASRSESNATMLQQTAGSIGEISDTIRSAASTSQDAKRYVEEVSKKAASGTELAQKTRDAMDEIHNSSNAIAKIVAVIDEIAFQTNLLALNAGVEAARAGEAGRGFAVVATEVRSLAQRTSESSREITQLIDAATASIERGVEMVDVTASSLGGIAGDVQEVSGQIETIAGSFEETRQGIDAISASTAELDQTTQANVGMLSDANTALRSLNDEVNLLESEVGVFKIDAMDTSKGHGKRAA